MERKALGDHLPSYIGKGLSNAGTSPSGLGRGDSTWHCRALVFDLCGGDRSDRGLQPAGRYVFRVLISEHCCGWYWASSTRQTCGRFLGRRGAQQLEPSSDTNFIAIGWRITYHLRLIA
ncbi:hypothetical protein OH76DRAFT_16737 [Lentinus brumalis]|uniref:Uncharacterized protein n=1 Tax=Lentinus brumalis TaxID=2498619 RepID=A0A371DX77_9APHY|nr:hypothetical protein OH76DRAFT_16737 [Polyporus brumalis]